MTLKNRQKRYNAFIKYGNTKAAEELKAKYPDVEAKKEEPIEGPVEDNSKSKGKK